MWLGAYLAHGMELPPPYEGLSELLSAHNIAKTYGLLPSEVAERITLYDMQALQVGLAAEDIQSKVKR